MTSSKMTPAQGGGPVTSSSARPADGEPPAKKSLGSRRLMFVGLLNVVASMAVVLLHTSLGVYSPARDAGWVECAAIQSLAIFAVPVFLMIGGMNLIGYRDRCDTGTFLWRRVRRAGVALLAGSVVCYLAYGLFPGSFWGAQAVADAFGPKDFLKRLLTNQVNDVYWYFYMIVGMYVVTPVLSLAARDRRTLEYVLACTAIAGFGVPLAVELGVNPDYLSELLGWPLFSSWALFYYVGGYYLRAYVLPRCTKGPASRVSTWLAVALLAAAGMFVAALATNGYLGGGEMAAAYDRFPASVPSPLCAVESLGVFMTAALLEPRLRRMGERARVTLATLSGAALEVYLFHMLVITWIGAHVDLAVLAPLPGMPVAHAAVVYVVTMVLVVVGRAVRRRVGRAVRRRGAEADAA